MPAAKEYDGENKYIRITDIDDDSREFKQEDIDFTRYRLIFC